MRERQNKIKPLPSKLPVNSLSDMCAFKNLPVDIYQLIARQLDTQSLSRVRQSSTSMCHFFSKLPIYREQLSKEFMVPTYMLKKLLSGVEKKHKRDICERVYRKLGLFQSDMKKRKLPEAISFGMLAKPFLLACCADDVKLFQKFVPTFEMERRKMFWSLLSFYTGTQRVSRLLLDTLKWKGSEVTVLYYAASSGNLAVVKYILDSKNSFKIKANHLTLDRAVISGSLELVRYFLDNENNFQLKPNQKTLNLAARSGSLNLLCYLLDSENEFELRVSQKTLNFAAGSGSTRIMRYLMDQRNGFRLNPDQNTLERAVDSGSIKLLSYLLDPANKFQLGVDQDTLKHAKYSDVKLYQNLKGVINFTEAFSKAIQGQFDGSLFLIASGRWPEHVKRCLEYIVLNPKRYGLSNKMLEKIGELEKELKVKKELQPLSNESKTIPTLTR